MSEFHGCDRVNNAVPTIPHTWCKKGVSSTLIYKALESISKITQQASNGFTRFVVQYVGIEDALQRVPYTRCKTRVSSKLMSQALVSILTIAQRVLDGSTSGFQRRGRVEEAVRMIPHTEHNKLSVVNVHV